LGGNGVDASRHDRLFWLAWHAGCRTRAELACHAARSLGREGPPAEVDEARAQLFLRSTVPLWKRLGILGA
jgi:hypothetical protein